MFNLRPFGHTNCSCYTNGNIMHKDLFVLGQRNSRQGFQEAPQLPVQQGAYHRAKKEGKGKEACKKAGQAASKKLAATFDN